MKIVSFNGILKMETPLSATLPPPYQTKTHKAELLFHNELKKTLSPIIDNAPKNDVLEVSFKKINAIGKSSYDTILASYTYLRQGFDEIIKEDRGFTLKDGEPIGTSMKDVIKEITTKIQKAGY